MRTDPRQPPHAPPPPGEPAPPLTPGVLALLRCPVTQRPLALEVLPAGPRLIAQGVNNPPGYPIVNGIPILLAEAAERSPDPREKSPCSAS